MFVHVCRGCRTLWRVSLTVLASELDYDDLKSSSVFLATLDDSTVIPPLSLCSKITKLPITKMQTDSERFEVLENNLTNLVQTLAQLMSQLADHTIHEMPGEAPGVLPSVSNPASEGLEHYCRSPEP
jgi:hypothetical protein